MMAHNGVEFSYNLKAPNKSIQVGAEPLPLSSIPANIRHKFGDSDCERLLNDPHLVSSTWHRTQRSAKRYKNPHVYYQDRPVNSPASVKSEEQPYGTVLLRNTYQDMSRIARNAFPGESLTDEIITILQSNSTIVVLSLPYMHDSKISQLLNMQQCHATSIVMH